MITRMQIFFIRIQPYIFITSFNDAPGFTYSPYLQENPQTVLVSGFGTEREINRELAITGFFLLWPHPSIVCSQLQILQLF